ncbi:hypothetical protein LJK87_26205 [Paenibacillus sp. P25]|nr:hypothetical protein LJK87_26205 [Paenibacillus sp. P25]
MLPAGWEGRSPLATGNIMDTYRAVPTVWTLAALMAVMMLMLVIAIRYSKKARTDRAAGGLEAGKAAVPAGES